MLVQMEKAKKWITIKKVGSTLQLVCLIIALGVGFCMLCSSGFIVGSNSMEPTIAEGDFVFLWNLVQPEKLEEGDIAGYESTDGLVVIHRTVSPYLDADLNRVSWKMRGDANEGDDVQVLTAENMVGKMFLHIDNAHVPLFKLVLRLIYLIPVLLVCIGGMLKVYADMKLSGTSSKASDKSK